MVVPEVPKSPLILVPPVFVIDAAESAPKVPAVPRSILHMLVNILI
jgi:hypothetical protein